jgi:rhodanese-related sulfurtransferase
MNIKKIITYLSIIIVVLFLGNQFLGNQSVKSISTSELENKLQQKQDSTKVVYIDVRETYEFESGHIKGMENVPLSTLKSDYNKIPKDAEVVLICRSGNRSKQAAEILTNLGYHNIVNVDGGIQSWQGELVH